ncbi:uncharacterized protein DS421_4g131090 [Arachis hypogaea]|uniref:Uncharacterized protein n=1 Tax=Arachis hypogaea TaxID=3818 RepID=A0A445DD56_ARAHY|nr:uncharacterized protein DS421_4g131090 [Arachis hypogaea]RYR61080.1 hypothetical protein Ahy_A04g018188 [Arachis hypogaea]
MLSGRQRNQFKERRQLSLDDEKSQKMRKPRGKSRREGLTVEGILETWIKLKPIVMEEWDENRDELIDLFRKVRDDWLQNDFSGWMGANRFYLGTADALRFASSKKKTNDKC